MLISQITTFLETLAPSSLQENYDNAGLLTGRPEWECTGIICSLDATEEVIREAIEKGCNLVVAHHPIIFGGLKKITGRNYVENTVITAIKNDIAIYAIHTNLDNVIDGVSGRMARELGLQDVQVLSPRRGLLRKLHTFVPVDNAPALREALFATRAGTIGAYTECSFNISGIGTFRPGDHTNPFVGEKGKQHEETEVRVEVIYPAYLESAVVTALRAAHPYEEPAFDLVPMENAHPGIGSGVMGMLPEPLDAPAFLKLLKTVFQVPMVRHSPLTGRNIQRVALCGGAGSFLISKALSAGVDAFITADLKYHEFFDANSRLLLADIGHYESERCAIALLQEVLAEKFPTFAVLKTAVETNPVHYS